MKYYSDVTKKLYDEQAALVEDEAKELKKQSEAEELAKQRKARAKEIEDAFKAVVDAQAHYTELKNKFIEDYGSYHMSLSNKVPVKTAKDFDKLIDLLFNL